MIFQVRTEADLERHKKIQATIRGDYGVRYTGWYFWDETGVDAIGPFETYQECLRAKADYEP